MNKANKIMIFLFVSFLLSINLAYAILPARSFSEAENRVLNQYPKFSINNIITGKFTNQFEEYVIDQIVFRDKWVGLKSDFERLLQKKENNGVYFGYNNYLFEKYGDPTEIKNNINNINYFSNKLPNVDVSVLLAPNSSEIYKENLPKFSENFNQQEVLNDIKKNLDPSINFSNIYSTLLSKKDEYVYFKTDHHWTMRGAYYAYSKLFTDIGVSPFDLVNFKSEFISDSFYGSYYSKANNKHLPADRIEIFTPLFDIDYKIEYKDNNQISDTMFYFSFLAKRDKYAMFLGGNHALLTINTSINNSKKLIVFKDSYANSILPFLANHYQEIHVVDLRYYKLNIYEYIEEHNIENALFLYNLGSFANDSTLMWLNR